SFPVHPLPEPDVLAVVFSGVRLGSAPARLVVEVDPSARAPGPEAGLARRLVDGEERVTLPLGPGERARFEVRGVPRRPRALTFGVATALGEGAAPDAPDAEARWRVHVGGAEVEGEARPGRGFADATVAWPADAPASGQAVVVVENRGATPFLLAQPIVRGPPPGEVPAPPNLLLISLDTLRKDHLSCYGHPRPTSPFLDRFAAGAVRFEHCLSPSSHTLPSHASLLTGRLPPEHGAVNDARRLDARFVD